MKLRLIGAMLLMVSLPMISEEKEKAQTTAEEREHLRELAQGYEIANKAVNDMAAKLTEQLKGTKEFMARAAIQETAEKEVKRLQEKCQTGGKELSLDVGKVETYLRCVDKPKDKDKK